MKKLLSICTNWRNDVFMLLVCATMLLALCEADSFVTLVASKALAVATGYVAYRLYVYWDKKGLITEISDYFN
ncbi:MAG: hypothetical protein IJ197_08865 [Bacteroidaceae bacterium]|nr:hypothetical protein [Bacteroidaceae bacterium]